MKQKILITGIAGSGKSTTCQELLSLGFEAYGIEDIDGMFEMYHKGTHRVFEDYDNSDPEKIKNADWLCDLQKLQQLLEKQEQNIAFYCGVASNIDELIPLFDKVVLLKVDSGILYQRLLSREGTKDIGNTEASRQTVLGWKDWWEGELIKKGVLVVDASDQPREVTAKILALSGQS